MMSYLVKDKMAKYPVNGTALRVYLPLPLAGEGLGEGGNSPV